MQLITLRRQIADFQSQIWKGPETPQIQAAISSSSSKTVSLFFSYIILREKNEILLSASYSLVMKVNFLILVFYRPKKVNIYPMIRLDNKSIHFHVEMRYLLRFLYLF